MAAFIGSVYASAKYGNVDDSCNDLVQWAIPVISQYNSIHDGGMQSIIYPLSDSCTHLLVKRYCM